MAGRASAPGRCARARLTFHAKSIPCALKRTQRSGPTRMVFLVRRGRESTPRSRRRGRQSRKNRCRPSHGQSGRCRHRWIGQKRPTGTALKLLHLVQENGLDSVAQSGAREAMISFKGEDCVFEAKLHRVGVCPRNVAAPAIHARVCANSSSESFGSSLNRAMMMAPTMAA